MTVQIFCPKCDRSCRIKPEYLGKRVRCPGCQEVFKAEEVPLAEMEDEPAAADREPRKEPEDTQHRKGKKEAPLVKPGRLSNPFQGSTTLPAVEPDPTAFDFDFDDEPVSSKKKSANRKQSDEEDDDDERPRSRPAKRARSSDREAPDTKYAWGDGSSPPDDLPEDSPRSGSG